MGRFRFLIMLAGTAALSLSAFGSPAAGAAGPAKASHSTLRMKFVDGTEVTLRGTRFEGSDQQALDQVNALLGDGPRIKPLFVQPAEEHRNRRSDLEKQGKHVPDLTLYYRVVLADGTEAQRVSSDLRSLAVIEEAYAEPLAALPSSTPSFENLQHYLNAAPIGIDTRNAVTFPGGKGGKVRLFDIEYAWNTAHEDLSKARAPGAVVNNGTPTQPYGPDHGTAVLGEIAADVNGIGVSGAAPDVELHLVNAANVERGWDIPNAIATAAGKMSAGDVMLIEQQTWGPNGQFVPVEWEPAIYDAIRVATASGLIVIEAAGNGGENLDGSTYGSSFPMGKADSGAIIAGAGAACDGSSHLRSRLSFSNYGQRVNLQGWGECVTTTGGYGDLQYGSPNTAYTSSFNGTSSASPIVASAAASLSSAYEQLNGTSPTPAWVRATLVATGTAQDPSVAGHIGPLPDLAHALLKTDKTAPTGPSQLTVTVTSNHQVQLRWAASTDNVRVANYRVFRNGSLLATTSGASTTFLDTTAKRNKSSYYVKALDASDNLSAASNQITVKP